MAITLNRTTLNAYLRIALASPTGLPKTIAMMIGMFPPFDVNRTFLTQSAPSAGQTASLYQGEVQNSGVVRYGQRTSVGGYYDGLGSAGDTYLMSGSIANTGFVLKPFFLVATSNTSFQYFGPGFPSGKTLFDPSPGGAGELAACVDLIIGALLSNATYSAHMCMSVAEVALWDDARTSGNYTSYAAGTLAETISPGTLRDVWPLNDSGAAGAAAPSSYTGIVNSLVLSATGDVTYAHQAHPVTRSGPATITENLSLSEQTVGLASSDHAQAESTTVAETVSATVTAGSQGSIISEPLKRNNGTLAASSALNYVALYDRDTNALVLRKTGLATNALGVVSFTDPAVVQGVDYRIDWEEASGQRRMPIRRAE